MQNKIPRLFEEIKKSIDKKEYSEITRKKLAKKLGVSPRTINRWIRTLIDNGEIIRIDLSHEKPPKGRRLYLKK